MSTNCNTADVSRATTIEVRQTVTLKSAIPNSTASKSDIVLNQAHTVSFNGYSSGQHTVTNGTTNLVLVPQCNMVIISSDQPLTIVAGGATIANTKRFSYESDTQIAVDVSNASGTDANVDVTYTTHP